MVFFFNDTATTEIYTLSLHDALPISTGRALRYATAMITWFRNLAKSWVAKVLFVLLILSFAIWGIEDVVRNIGLTSGDRKSTRPELQSRQYLVCRLLLEQKNSPARPR